METTYTKTRQFNLPITKSLGWIALIVLLSCLGLGYLDHETKSIADLFKPGNIMALMLYFIPTFAISSWFFKLFLGKKDRVNSIVFALLSGIPVGFTLVIVLLYFWIH